MTRPEGGLLHLLERTGVTTRPMGPGTNQDQQLVGSIGDDFLRAAGGDDTILGLGGDDNLGGGNGDDIVNGGSGDDRVRGGEGSDRVFGGSGEDSVVGGGGDDTIYGGSDVDVLSYRKASGGVRAALDDETLEENPQSILIDARSARLGMDKIIDVENLIGSNHDDWLAGVGSNSIRGLEGNDFLRGWNDDDKLIGGSGNDTLFGDDGADTLIGGAGSDRLDTDQQDFIDGDNREDWLVFKSASDSFGASSDKVFHFASGEDKIVLRGDIKATDGTFEFIGAADFSGQPGEIRFEYRDYPGMSRLEIDLDGDQSSDFTLLFFYGIPKVDGGDFVFAT